MFLDKNYWRDKRNKFLLNSFSLPESGNLLDLSCGDGKLLCKIQKLKPNLGLYGIDISKEDIELAIKNNPRINFQQSQATSLPFPDNHFDIIICSMSLHHYDNLNQVIAEVKRVLKDSGKVYFMDIMPANKYTQKIYNAFGCHEPYHFEKFYTATEIESRIDGYKSIFHKQSRTLAIFRIELIGFMKS